MGHIFAILWNLCLLALLVIMPVAMIYVMLSLSSFIWPLVLLVVVAAIVMALAR